MSKHKVLARKSAAIETLGATTVLCVDKTGTITLNQIGLSGIYKDGQYIDLEKSTTIPESFHALLEYAQLSSQQDPFDPMEKAINKSIQSYLTDDKHSHSDWHMVREYPLSKKLLSISRVWSAPDARKYVIAAKGSPEAMANLCHLNSSEMEQLEDKINELAGRGLRLLGVARAELDTDKLPNEQHGFNFEFLGLLGFSDPVRSGVSQAVSECYRAGLRIIMITGDYPGTAQYIATKIGLKNPEVIITGNELEEMGEEAAAARIQEVNVFARVVPEQKLIIVDALKRHGEIVAMTGDGVNDAPALKSANIGVAMGQRGTDVAREASDIVLLDDDFSSIVQGVKMGRRIFDNLKKAMSYIFAVHIPIAGLALIPVIFKLPIVLMPAHLAFLELIIDPTCSVVFESETEEHNIMKRPPRSLKESLFSKNNIVVGLLQGAVIFCWVLAIYGLWILLGKGEAQVRTMSFATLIFANQLLIITNLSRSKNIFEIIRGKNKSLYWILGVTTVLFVLILVNPTMLKLFHFSPLAFWEILLAFGVGMISIIWFEGVKLYRQKMAKR